MKCDSCLSYVDENYKVYESQNPNNDVKMTLCRYCLVSGLNMIRNKMMKEQISKHESIPIPIS